MSPYRLSLRVCPFSKVMLEEEILLASKAAPESAPATQVRFLASYLANPEAGAQTILIEWPYVDRHFLEEYANYYATTLHPPPPKATRIHFFASEFTTEEFTQTLERAADNDYDAVCAEMTSRYLGFTVIRPLPDAPIGRTILGTYQNPRKPRWYTLPPHPYKVHLCGLRLHICGVPFQQQEQAVGACATSAVWSALAQVMRTDGGRAPTPFAVTEAATRHWLIDRVYPAKAGLKNEQILEAIRHFGYAPLFFEPDVQPTLFTLAVKCYLKSRIPVVLKIKYPGETEAHAVTVVGFCEDDIAEIPNIQHKEPGWSMLSLRSKGLTRVYVHDDGLGPYSRAAWRTDPTSGFIKMRYITKDLDFKEFDEEADVEAAMVPLYPKIRLSAQDMVGFAGELLPFFRELVGPDCRDDLLIDLQFSLAGTCMDLLYRSEIPPSRVATFAREAVLSRYVGIITFSVGNELVAFVICDSTDMRRQDLVRAAPLLAILPKYDQHIEAILDFTKKYGNNALVS